MLDKHSPAVTRLTGEIDKEIDRLHRALERPGKAVSEYDFARGQIKALRWTLKKIIGDEDDLTDG